MSNLPTYIDLIHLIGDNNVEALKAHITAYPEILDWNTFSIEQGILHHAVGRERLAFSQYFVSVGVDVNGINEGGQTPLSIAAGDGNLEIVKWLIDCGAGIDGYPTDIQSPLMNAIIPGHVAIARLLIDLGADLTRLNNRLHTTALDLAMIWGQPEIERMLREKGAPSTLQPTNWEQEYGGAILRFIDGTFGKVLPIRMAQIIGEAAVDQRLALVNKNKHKMVFTIGLFNIHQPMLELFIVLPADWNMHVKTRENQFPAMLLRAISARIADGLRIKEGHLITADGPAYAALHWPASLVGFWVCDNYWGGKESGDPAIPEDDQVDLWTLLPIKRRKSGTPQQYPEKSRTAGWAALTLHLDPAPRPAIAPPNNTLMTPT